MRSSRFCPAVCLWSACAALTALPVLAQSNASVVPVVTPLQGAAAVLDHAHKAKNLAALNEDLTNESAAFMGVSLDLVVSGLSAVILMHTPRSSQEAGVQKAYQAKADALLNHALQTSKMPQKTLQGLNGSGTLPPSFAFRGHQFLSRAIALSDAYEKTGSPNKGGPLSTQFGQNVFPAASDCDFHVLSPVRVQIMPRSRRMLPAEARLQDGRWRLDIRNRWPKAPST